MTLRAAVIALTGTHRVADVSLALTLAGASPEVMLLDELANTPEHVHHAQLLAVVGGNGVVGSSSNDLESAFPLDLGDEFRRFAGAGKPIIGIGGGFHMLINVGLLPGALQQNTSGHFRCEWVTLEAPATRCVWTQALAPIECPIAMCDSRYVHPDFEALADNGQVALRYLRGTAHGSVGDIAGVCDASGLVLGLVPQPELHVVARQHPQHRMPSHRPGKGLALTIFERGVLHAKRT